jgi:hypothetical protein
MKDISFRVFLFGGMGYFFSCFAGADVPRSVKIFSDLNVQNYGQFWIDNLVPDSVPSEPKEISEVVGMGKSAVPYLIGFLDDSKASIRVAAIVSLTEITNKRFGTINDFETQSGENDSRTKALNQWKRWWENNKRKSSTRWFIEDLKDQNEIVRKDAAIRLGELKAKIAIPALKEALNDLSIKMEVEQSLKEIRE